MELVGGLFSVGNNNSQPNTYTGDTFVSGGTLLVNSDNGTGLATQGALGVNGTVFLNGGKVGPRSQSRTILNQSAVTANTTFVNNVTMNFAGVPDPDASNSSLTLQGPMRLEGSRTLTNNMSSGTLTISGSIYDNPFIAPSALTLQNTGSAVETVLTKPNVHRGGTIVDTGIVRVQNSFGSATGTGNVTVVTNGELRGGNSAGTQGFLVPATGGSVTVNGAIHPGNGLASIGILTIGSVFTDTTTTISGASSKLVFNLAATNPGSATPIFDGSSTTAIGTGNNFLRGLSLSGASSMSVLPNTLTINSVVSLTNWDPTMNYSWQVATLSSGTVNSWGPNPSPVVDTTNFNNALVGGLTPTYPANNFFPVSYPGVQFVDFAIQERGKSLRHAWETWMGKAEGKAAIDYGFHMIVTDVNDASIEEMKKLVTEGVTSFI
jgi:hypothetical protein